MTTAPLDHLARRNLESYLFGLVRTAFHNDGHISAFDFFSIVIWKANRSKSMTAKHLLDLGARHGLHDLEMICRRASSQVHAANTDKKQFAPIVKHWKLALPMTSTILWALYPERFSVYDCRVCEELARLGRPAWTTDFQEQWERYMATVSQGTNLRDKNSSYLTGLSMASQLRRDITQWSTPGYFNGR